MESYFHQDYDLNGSGDAAILIEYAQSSWPSDVAATINEINAILKQPALVIKALFEISAGSDGVIVGDTDNAVRKWLVEAKKRWRISLVLPTISDQAARNRWFMRDY